jgi:AcrR family transcriptional regulator
MVYRTRILIILRAPKQTRSQATADRLVDAAEALIAERALGDVSVADILRRAAVSAGSFYARFGSKDALVRHLADRFWARARDEWADRLDPARWVGQPSAVIVERVVRETVRAHRRHWFALRGFVQYGLANPESHLLNPARDLDGFVAGRLATLLLARRGGAAHTRHDLAIELGYLQVVGTLRDIVVFGWPKAAWVPLSDEAMTAELTRAYLAYLGIRRA